MEEKLHGLIISRKPNEGSVILEVGGEKIQIAVSKIKGNQVRLLFCASQNVKITRSEVYGDTTCVKKEPLERP